MVQHNIVVSYTMEKGQEVCGKLNHLHCVTKSMGLTFDLLVQMQVSICAERVPPFSFLSCIPDCRKLFPAAETC